jgi:hypothetical protein
MCLNVLITNHYLKTHSGTELYVRDVALELKRLGHTPAVFSPLPGRVAEEVREAGIQVESDLARLDFSPDVIHGHNTYEALAAIHRYPKTPAIYICHANFHKTDVPPRHSHILRYYGISGTCIDRILASGVPSEKIELHTNFVDLKRFAPRPPLPERPKRALVFSNYASEDGYLPAVREACRQAGIELSVVGKMVGNLVENPQDIIGDYDIVFAIGKSAIEGLAVGCAVVLCGTHGVGPMVTESTFAELRAKNFGYATLTEAHAPETILAQIERYDAEDAKRVGQLMRSVGGLEDAAANLLRIYHDVIDEAKAKGFPCTPLNDAKSLMTVARFGLKYKGKALWRSLRGK